MARVMVAFNRDELQALQLGILLEMENKAKTGRSRRILKEQLTEAERRLVAKGRKFVWQWEMVRGYPKEKVMAVSTYQTLQKIVGVYASL